jgi:hypothetical protein
VLRTALFVAITVVASPARADVPQLSHGVLLDGVMLDVKCATPEERSATVQHLNSKIDWFLSRLEVPAAIAKQFDEVDWGDPAASMTGFAHPWFRAHLIRAGAPHLKSQLASLLTETNRETRLKEAITAYGDGAGLAVLLREHAGINPDERITDKGTWYGQAVVLEDAFRRFAVCLVDVPSEVPQQSESQR